MGTFLHFTVTTSEPSIMDMMKKKIFVNECCGLSLQCLVAVLVVVFMPMLLHYFMLYTYYLRGKLNCVYNFFLIYIFILKRGEENTIGMHFICLYRLNGKEHHECIICIYIILNHS